MEPIAATSNAITSPAFRNNSHLCVSFFSIIAVSATIGRIPDCKILGSVGRIGHASRRHPYILLAPHLLGFLQRPWQPPPMPDPPQQSRIIHKIAAKISPSGTMW
jgi:hypothetical protein